MLTGREPKALQTWAVQFTSDGVSVECENPSNAFTLGTDYFDRDARMQDFNWRRAISPFGSRRAPNAHGYSSVQER